MSVTKYDNYHCSQDTVPVDALMSGETDPGITFEDVTLLADRPRHYLLDLVGEETWVPKDAVISMTMDCCGEMGEVVLTEESAIRLGLV